MNLNIHFLYFALFNFLFFKFHVFLYDIYILFSFNFGSIHRTMSTPVGKTVELPPAQTEFQSTPPVPTSEQNGNRPASSAEVYNGDSDDIPPNPWLQQLRKTKSVFR